ncbi:hypothetical protein HDU85_006789 [Gaertneriomyces sp. JEL0708]|nr:hypothetical protein HDU85_006789 [Gaertneriomyces sp. JEL0708]
MMESFALPPSLGVTSDEDLLRSFLDDDLLTQTLGATDQTSADAFLLNIQPSFYDTPCSPETSASHSDVASSPSSGPTAPSPNADWMLDFDDLPALLQTIPNGEDSDSTSAIPFPSSVFSPDVSQASSLVPNLLPLPPSSQVAASTVKLEAQPSQSTVWKVSPLISGTPVRVPSPCPPPSPPNSDSSPTKPKAARRQNRTPEEKLESRKQRLIKNREAAMQSRKRKREHMENLEALTDQLTAENTSLKLQVELLTQQNVLLTQENTSLKRLLSDNNGRSLDYDQELGGVARGALKNNKKAGVMLMVSALCFVLVGIRGTYWDLVQAVLFSFMMMAFLPGMVTYSSHSTSIQIASKAFSERQPIQRDQPLLDAAPTILYLPSSSSLAPSSPGSAPHVNALSRPQIESSVKLPLDGHFKDRIRSLSVETALSQESRGKLDKLHALFDGEDVNVVLPNTFGVKPSMEKRSMNHGYELSSSGAPYQGSSFMRTAAHGATYASERAGAAIPFATVSDSLHLLPYLDRQPMPSPLAECCSEHGASSPKLSLVASLAPEGDGPVSYGGYLQLDMAVINAKFVKWNAAGSTGTGSNTIII